MVAYTKKFIKEIKEKLEKLEKKLTEELSQFSDSRNSNDDSDARFPEYGESQEDNAMEVTDFTHNLTVEHTLEKELEDVHIALKRIDDNEYGICKYCKKTIEEKRVLARPTSNSCVACKKALKQEI